VAIGFAFESIDGHGAVPSGTLEGNAVHVDGEAALLFASAPHPDPDHGFLVPVPHRTSVRVVLPLSATATYPSVVPSPEQVAAGWEVQVRRGARAELPDRARQAQFEAGRRDLLLRTAGDHVFEGIGELAVAPRSPASLAVALDELGFHPEAGLLLAGLVEDADEDLDSAFQLVTALARHDELTDDVALAKATRRFRKRASRASERAATPGSVPVDPMSALRAGIVDDRPDRLVLLAGWERGWAGQPVEAHDFPTRFGAVSFGVRWHGERPAVLWEVRSARADPGPRPHLCLPALDPNWSSGEMVGEALLAPLAPVTSGQAVER
jgi:hypothetical protein